jgi:hypothetical protein
MLLLFCGFMAAELIKDNIVLSVIVLSLIVWTPASCAITAYVSHHQ